MKTITIETSDTLSPATLFRILARRWHRHERYRPERHYMRGPGPKCREKHDLGTAQ